MYSGQTFPACPVCSRPIPYVDKKLYGFPVCGSCHNNFMLKRVLAHVLDVVFYSIFAWFSILILFFVAAIAAGAASSGASQEAQDRAASFAISVWILALLGTMLLRTLTDGFRGHSPGKAIFGLQVIDRSNGRPAGFFDSFQRNLVLLVPFMPIIILVLLLTGDGQRPGDGWARTKVIWKQYRRTPPFLPEHDWQAQELNRAARATGV